MKILIQHNLSAKVKDVQNLEGLHNAVQHMFQLAPTSYFLQKFNIEFEDFVDLEETDTLMEKDKIRVITRPQDVLDLNNSLTFTSQEANFQRVEIIQEIQAEPAVELAPIEIPLPRKPWPKEIIIPFEDFSKPLKDCLNSQGNLTGFIP